MVNTMQSQDAQSETELDFSDAGGDQFASLARDRIFIRSMTKDDLAPIVAIDRHHTGRDRRAYYERKMGEAMDESGVRISLVAELDNGVAGFMMARLDYGDFGMTEPAAVIDTIGINPGFERQSVASALLSQLLTNLATLRVESVRTEVDWSQFDLLQFLDRFEFTPSQRLAFRRALD